MHTQGPWTVADTTEPIMTVSAGYHFICRAHRKNAILIAAAPDLLTACQAVVSASNSGADTIGFLVELRRVALLCNAALARCSSQVEQPQ